MNNPAPVMIVTPTKTNISGTSAKKTNPHNALNAMLTYANGATNEASPNISERNNNKCAIMPKLPIAQNHNQSIMSGVCHTNGAMTLIKIVPISPV